MRTDWEYRREESSLWEFIMPLIFSWSIEFVLEALEVCGGFWTGEDGGVWKLSDEVDDEDDDADDDEDDDGVEGDCGG